MSLKQFGTLLEYGDTADHATATTWTPIAEVKTITPPKVTAADINTTHLTSPDEHEESEPGMASSSDVELSIRYAVAATTTLYGFFRTKKAWRVRYPDDSGWKFNGYIREYGDEEADGTDIVMTGLRIKPSSKPVHDTDLTA